MKFLIGYFCGIVSVGINYSELSLYTLLVIKKKQEILQTTKLYFLFFIIC